MALVNDSHKQAVKVVVARLVVQGGDPVLVAGGVLGTALEFGLHIGDLASLSALAKYGYGVQAKGERASNRRWSEYPADVRHMAALIAQGTKTHIAEYLGQ